MSNSLADLVRPMIETWKAARAKYDLLLAKAQVLAKRVSGESNSERRAKMVDELAKETQPEYKTVGSYFSNLLLQLGEFEQDSDELIITLDYLASMSGIWRNWCSELLDDRLSESEVPAAEVPGELRETHAELRELRKEMGTVGAKISAMGPALELTDPEFLSEHFTAAKKFKLETPKGKLPGQVNNQTYRPLHMTLTLAELTDPENIVAEYALDDGPIGYQWSHLLRKITVEHGIIPMTPRQLANYVEVADVEFSEWTKALMTVDGGWYLGTVVRADVPDPEAVADAEELDEDEESEDDTDSE